MSIACTFHIDVSTKRINLDISVRKCIEKSIMYTNVFECRTCGLGWKGEDNEHECPNCCVPMELLSRVENGHL